MKQKKQRVTKPRTVDGATPESAAPNAGTAGNQRLLQRVRAGGLPDEVRSGLEALSGMDLSNVRVHRNSSKPRQLQAHAYTEGDDIHVAPGQDRHLPHEGWHVVQQRQGRVAPTGEVAGKPLNDDPGLEREAEAMGRRAARAGRAAVQRAVAPATPQPAPGMIQRGTACSTCLGANDEDQAVEDPFADLPGDAIAIREDGLYITAPGGLDGILHGADFKAFTSGGDSAGQIYLSGVQEKDDYISYYQINNEIEGGGKGASLLVAWYFTRFTTQPYFEVHSVGNFDLAATLEKLGMENYENLDWRGPVGTVYERARVKLLEHGWRLRGE